MTAPLMTAVTEGLVADRFSVLRFNFRGVGLSQGAWGMGEMEVEDVAAAVTHAEQEQPDLPLGLAGWSFGATTSLKWHLRSESSLPWAGIAPGLRPYRGSSVPDLESPHSAARLVIAGDRDQFGDVPGFEGFAEALGARLEIVNGSDHFFYFRYEVVAGLLAEHFAAASGAGAAQV